MTGIVAFAVPLWLAPPLQSFMWLGLPVLLPGVAVLLWCVWAFYAAGKGTLAPWSPPRHLVTVGLYRYSRNPMYVGVLLILLGWAVGFQSWPLALYAAAVTLAFHLRVVFGEEPVLARHFGEEWRTYCRRTPRWLGRRQQ